MAGFDYEKEGLSAEEAGTIASLFARFDLNDDGAQRTTSPRPDCKGADSVTLGVSLRA